MGIAERIKAARKKAGLTQAQLAERSGVAAISIHQYEAGKRNPQLEQLARISRVIGTTLYELAGPDYFSSYTQAELAQMWKELPFSDGPAHDRLDAAMAQMTLEGQNKVADYAEDILPRYRRQEAPPPSIPTAAPEPHPESVENGG